MSGHARGTFKVSDWKEEPYNKLEGESKLTRASVKQTLQGDIQGEGSIEYLMAYRRDKTADFVGILYVEGMLGGRSGSFALRITGLFDGEMAAGTWSVIPGLESEELNGLRGEGGFRAPHGSEASYTLDYAFGDAMEDGEDQE